MSSLVRIVLILLPRSAIAYPLYVFAACLSYKLNLGLFKALLSAFLLFSVLFLVLQFAYQVSPTAFVIEFVLLLPLLLFIGGAQVKPDTRIDTIRVVSLLTFIASILNLFTYGFPAKLPYIHYLPDAYGAFYGLGGAKIVTIIGFFSLFTELNKPKKSRLFLFVAIANFLIPNYMIGIASGVGALSVIFIRKLSQLIILIFLVCIAYWGLNERLGTVNSLFLSYFGVSPKVFQFTNLYYLFSENIALLLTGTGLGQYCSTAAQWSSDFLRSVSTHSIPNIPGMFMSEFHDIYMGDALNLVNKDKWALSSSFNKPYGSVSTMIAEMGPLIFIYIAIRFYTRLGQSIKNKVSLNSIAIFTGLLFLLDTWHDSPWFFFMLAGVCANYENVTSNSRSTKMRHNQPGECVTAKS